MARTVEYLEIHEQVEHLGVKRFKCEVEDCQKEFSKNNYLIIHRKTHDTSNSFPCVQCTFSSHLKKNLNRHIQRHHVAWNLNCDQCDYIGPSKESLQMHHKKYHSGKIYECLQCDKKYRDRAKYLLHVRRDHQGIRYK